MGQEGYLGFTDSTWFRDPPIFVQLEAGRLLAAGVQWQQPPAGGTIPLFYGGAVYQRPPAEVHAPLDLGGAQVSMDVLAVAGEEDQIMLLASLGSMLAAGPVPMWYPVPQVDAWVIPGAAKSEWSLSRSMPWGWGLAVTDFPPIVKVVDPADRQASADTVLTRSTSSPPSAGEYYVDTAANAIAIETDDISASAGLHLECLYYPIRLWGGSAGTTWVVPQAAEMRAAVVLTEHVPRRTYVGPD